MRYRIYKPRNSDVAHAIFLVGEGASPSLGEIVHVTDTGGKCKYRIVFKILLESEQAISALNTFYIGDIRGPPRYSDVAVNLSAA